MAYLRAHGTEDAAHVHSSVTKPLGKTDDGGAFAVMLGEVLSTSDPDAKRNSVENICNWTAHPDRYPDPDDAALIASVVTDALRD